MIIQRSPYIYVCVCMYIDMCVCICVYVYMCFTNIYIMLIGRLALKLSLHTTLFDSMATSASSVRLRRESSFKGSAGPKCKCNLVLGCLMTLGIIVARTRRSG